MSGAAAEPGPDRTGDIGSWFSLSKLQWATWHRDTTAELVTLLGPDAILYDEPQVPSEFPAYFLNARAETIYGGTNEIQKIILAERTLGLPRE